MARPMCLTGHWEISTPEKTLRRIQKTLNIQILRSYAEHNENRPLMRWHHVRRSRAAETVRNVDAHLSENAPPSTHAKSDWRSRREIAAPEQRNFRKRL